MTGLVVLLEQVLAKVTGEVAPYGADVIGVVMVTHDPHAAGFAGVIRHLEKGRLLAEGEAASSSVRATERPAVVDKTESQR